MTIQLLTYCERRLFVTLGRSGFLEAREINGAARLHPAGKFPKRSLIAGSLRNDLHPTMKPVVLIERAIGNSSESRATVLDPFGGSGSTLIELVGRGQGVALRRFPPKRRTNRLKRYPRRRL